MESPTAADILTFRHAVEIFSPQTVAATSGSTAREPIVDWTPAAPLPWEPDARLHPARRA